MEIHREFLGDYLSVIKHRLHSVISVSPCGELLKK